MTRLSEIENRNPTTAQRTVVLNAAINLARAMEKAQQTMRNKMNTASLIVTPPGFNQWPSALQRFVYLVTEICQCRGVDFAFILVILYGKQRISLENLTTKKPREIHN